jgi:hypothetical protein
LFSCFTLPDSFWSVPSASGPVFMFWARELIFGCTEGSGSCFHVLRSRTSFGRYQGRPVQFTCFALSDLFGTIPRALIPIFMFCAPGLIFNGTEDDRSRLHVLRSRTRFGGYRGRRVPFSCFALPDSFWEVPRERGNLSLFCAPGPVLGCTEGVGSRFLVLCSRTHLERYRGRRVPFFMFYPHF